MKTDTNSLLAADLKDDVLDELKWNPSVNETGIGVIVHDGVVTLTGAVESFAEKSAAEKAAQRVAGVQAVANEISIRLPGLSKRSDEEIARAVANAFAWHVFLPPDLIHPSVDHGWVTLRGIVDWQYQRSAAEKAIRHLRGVVGVTNEIQVRPAPSSFDVKAKIRAAFQRSAALEAARVHVESIDGRVVLTGTVRTLAEKLEAGWVAWAAPGVCRVDNELDVQ